MKEPLTCLTTQKLSEWLADLWTDWRIKRPKKIETVLLTGQLVRDRSANWLTDWLTDCPTDWLTDLLIDLLTYWLTDCFNDWQICWLTDWLTDWLNDWLTDWIIECLNDRRNDWLSNWLTDYSHIENVLKEQKILKITNNTFYYKIW